MSITWAQALSWRLRRHLLDPVGDGSVPDVVRRLGAVPAWPGDLAELAIRARRKRSQAGEVAQALAAGEVIKTYAFRGATHLLTPEEGGAFLALRAAGRMWERASWQSHYELAPDDWPRLREAVRAALGEGPLTRDELVTSLERHRGFRHLGARLDGNETLLKALAWQGDLSLGPARDGEATYRQLTDNPRWAGIPDLDDAGTWAVEHYLRTYGPATPEHLHYWLGSGLGAGRRRIESWWARVGDHLVEVDVEGETAHVLADDLDELRASGASDTVHLLPGHDQWVLGPGTADPHVVLPARRAVVSRKANLVIVGGVVAGTWTAARDRARVDWFVEAGPAPETALAEAVARLATIVDRPLSLVLS